MCFEWNRLQFCRKSFAHLAIGLSGPASWCLVPNCWQHRCYCKKKLSSDSHTGIWSLRWPCCFFSARSADHCYSAVWWPLTFPAGIWIPSDNSLGIASPHWCSARTYPGTYYYQPTLGAQWYFAALSWEWRGHCWPLYTGCGLSALGAAWGGRSWNCWLNWSLWSVKCCWLARRE